MKKSFNKYAWGQLMNTNLCLPRVEFHDTRQ